LIEDTLSFLETQGFNSYFAVSQLFLRKMEILYEWNQLDEFQRLVESILRQELLVDVPYLQVDIYNLQALAFLHKRDYPKAQDVLNRAKALARQSYIWEGLTWRMESLQMKLWLQKGDLSQAIAWNSQRTVGLDHLNRFSIESYELSRARILLAQGAGQEALSLLNRLANSAKLRKKGSLIKFVTQAVTLLGLKESTKQLEGNEALALKAGRLFHLPR
jgi:tetratricopeptide (TPR) repeat protein